MYSQNLDSIVEDTKGKEIIWKSSMKIRQRRKNTQICNPLCGQVHQHFTRNFFVRTSFRQHTHVEKAAKTTFVRKMCT